MRLSTQLSSLPGRRHVRNSFTFLSCDRIAAICFRMLVLAALKQTKMAYSRDEERSLISSFNKEQRKYGTTSTYVKKPERFISYEVQPGDTLQGISLKHNVTVSCSLVAHASFRSMSMRIVIFCASDIFIIARN